MAEAAIRLIRIPDDVPALRRLDTSFVTDLVYDVILESDTFRLVGRRLLNHALAEGATQGVDFAWLEVSNLNNPAVQAYRSLGFELCGLDTTFYNGTPAEGEVALFMSRRLVP